jgi:TPR repeat protein
LYNTGTQYFAGKGVEISMVKAAEYFEKAADLGFELAQVIANYLKYIAWI